MLTLISLADSDPSYVGTELSDMVSYNTVPLSLDFPHVLRHYGNPEDATRRVTDIGDGINLARGRHDAFIVRSGRPAIGLVTYSQWSKWLLMPGAVLPVRVSGPLIAGWLSVNRVSVERRKGIEVLRLLATRIAQQPLLGGNPWTVIRPENVVAIRRIEAVDNGFGGFRPLGSPRKFGFIDGVEAPRQLYVANASVRELARTYTQG